MKIGIVLAKPPGYTETFFRSKIAGLQENGFEVSLYCFEKDPNFSLCPVFPKPSLSTNPFYQLILFIVTYTKLLGSLNSVWRFIRLERKAGTSFLDIWKKLYLNAHILMSKVDWLHFGFATLAVEREFLAEAVQAKMAVSFRGFDIDVYPLKNPDAYNLLWRKVDKVHSISKYLLHKSYKLGLPKEKPFSIINPAVNFDWLSSFQTARNSTEKLQLVTVARLHWIKGIDLLISVAEKLRDKNIDFEWLVIGAGDKKEEQRYKYHLFEKGLEKQVKLLGARSHPDTIQMMKDSDIYIQTSLSEGFCNAIQEAQALGKACIAFSVGGIPENISNGNTGWLVENISSRAMAEKIYEVSKFSDPILKDQSISAIEKVKSKFSIDKQQLAFKRFYSS